MSIAGGTEVAQVYTSFMAQNQKGIVIGDNRKDYSGRVNARFNLFDGVVEVRANAQFREAERDNRNSSGIFKMAFGLNPTIPLYDPANPSKYNVVGNGISGTTFNPVADIMLRTKNGKDQWLLADATVKINLMKGLLLQGTVGIDKRQYQEYTYVSHDHKESIDNSRRGGASHKFSKDNRVSVEAYANYHRVFREDHTLAGGRRGFQHVELRLPGRRRRPVGHGRGFVPHGRPCLDGFEQGSPRAPALDVRACQLFV